MAASQHSHVALFLNLDLTNLPSARKIRLNTNSFKQVNSALTPGAARATLIQWDG